MGNWIPRLTEGSLRIPVVKVGIPGWKTGIPRGKDLGGLGKVRSGQERCRIVVEYELRDARGNLRVLGGLYKT